MLQAKATSSSARISMGPDMRFDEENDEGKGLKIEQGQPEKKGKNVKLSLLALVPCVLVTTVRVVPVCV